MTRAVMPSWECMASFQIGYERLCTIVLTWCYARNGKGIPEGHTLIAGGVN